MKKNYQVPSTKTKVMYKDIMAIVATSDGYEQGVGDDGTDREARSPIF